MQLWNATHSYKGVTTFVIKKKKKTTNKTQWNQNQTNQPNKQNPNPLPKLFGHVNLLGKKYS